MSKPPPVYVKARRDESLVELERKRAAAKHARSCQRTAPRAKQQRDKDKAEIAAYLSRVPPRAY